MTNNQHIEQFNKMRKALLTISKDYATTAQMQKIKFTDDGLEYEERLEYAYENIQEEAARAIKGIKELYYTPAQSI